MEMAHMIDETTGKPAIAFVGQIPWHGLGQEMEDGASMDQWRVAARLDWEYVPVQLTFQNPVTGLIVPFKNRQVLARSDTGHEMSIVSQNKYKIVQPGEILQFHNDLIEAGGFKMHTAGSLKDGKVVWALAEIGEDARIIGQDRIGGFLLLASSCDGMMATRAMFTSVRVVCNNTLQLADSAKGGIRVPHSKKFDPIQVAADLGVGPQMFAEFVGKAETLAKMSLSKKAAVDYIVRVMTGEDEVPTDISTLKNAKNIATVIELFNGKGMGSDLKSSKGTLWGAVNAITEYSDHHAGRGADSRLTSSWLGQGRLMKDRAMMLADQLVLAA